MPTYTYRCTKCGHAFERVQSMSDPPAKRCPECKSKVQRTFHPVGIVLKGSGFHKTDYRSSKDSESSTSSESSESSETKTETKGDTKEPSKEGSKKSEASTSSSKKDD